MTEQEIVKECLILIFKKNGYSDLNRLTQRDFDHISQEIENKTGTLISGATIKRLLNGEFSRLPQVATLDAISKYNGYRSWQEYKSSLRPSEELIAAKSKDGGPEHNDQQNHSVKSKSFKATAIALLVIGVVVIAGFIQFSDRNQFGDLDKATFSAHKNTANEIPNTVVFNYNVDEVKADSFFIQQSWDKNRKVRVFKNNYTLTDIYYEPGYHIAKLIANDSVIKAVDVSIPTDRWFLYSRNIQRGSRSEYINSRNTIRDGIFGLTETDVLQNKIDVAQERLYFYTFFPSKMEVSSDNYLLKTKVRMKQVKNNFCPFIIVEVFCQRYFMYVKNTPRGCASESVVQFGEQVISGKNRDLASLGTDVTQWMDIEISVRNRDVKISLNGEEAFSTSYKAPTKLITGLGFISNGLCEVDFVELKGTDGTIVYENDFEGENLLP